jgi:DNA-binding response OmpR family regulator
VLVDARKFFGRVARRSTGAAKEARLRDADGTFYGNARNRRNVRGTPMEEALVILVVEDDENVQSILEETLQEGGFFPAIASSGEEALLLLRGNRFGVLVIDIAFGCDRIRGWDVARRARAINPALPVIYITGASGHEWAVQGVPNSILLAKPFSPPQLAAAVSQLVTTASPFTA